MAFLGFKSKEEKRREIRKVVDETKDILHLLMEQEIEMVKAGRPPKICFFHEPSITKTSEVES